MIIPTVSVVGETWRPVTVTGHVPTPLEFSHHTRLARARFAGNEIGCHWLPVPFPFWPSWSRREPDEILRQPQNEVVIDGDRFSLLERSLSLARATSIRRYPRLA